MDGATSMSADFLSQAGLRFVAELRDDSEQPDAPPSLLHDWKTLAGWLGHERGELTALQQDKVLRAWNAYLSIGVAPSAALQPVFDKLATDRVRVSNERPPIEVMDVFDRLLATDKEVAAKRAADLQCEEARLQPHFANTRTAQPNWWWRQSPTVRTWVFGCLTWAVATLIYAFVFDPFEVGGWHRLDEDESLRLVAIGLAPVGAAVLAYTFNRWVKAR